MDIILGAGITGISYAAFCGHDDFLIIEKEPEIGGYCRTTKRNGFVWDYSGHFFHFQDEQIRDWVLSRMDVSHLVKVKKSTRIYYKGEFVDYPFQKNIHQLPKEELIDCLYDLFSERPTEYATFKEMLHAKFGKSIADKFLIPYNEKLYACDLDTLDHGAMGRFFPYAEKEEIIRNFKKGNNSSYNDSFLYPEGGAIEYVQSIASQIDEDRILPNAEVVRIDREKKLVCLKDGRELRFDRLISTVPLPQLLRMLGNDDPKNIYSSNKVLVFNLGFDQKGKNTVDHWIYFPDKQFVFYRVGFYDNILSQDRMSLYVEIGYPEEGSVTPEELLPRVLADLKACGIVGGDQQLVDHQVILMNPAYVHITQKSTEEIQKQKKLLESDSIFSIGRYGSWTYCSIEDNIKEARGLSRLLNS